MIENVPGIYNQPSIYNQGGTSQKAPINTPPEGCDFVEYIGLSYGGGYLNYNNNDGFRLGKTDKYYVKFSANLYDYNWGTLFSFFYPNGTKRVALEITSNTNVRFYNGGAASDWSSFSANIPNQDQLHYIIKTTNQLQTSIGQFNKVVDDYNDDNMFLSRPVSPGYNNSNKIYRYFISDKNDNIKFDFYPIYNNDTNKVGVWEKVTNTIKYPTSQTGVTHGGVIPF